jgi:RNA polymerase sigma factor (sigma-70 family)
MNYKKAEWLLYNYKKLKAEIKNIEIEIEDIKNTYVGVSAIDTSQESTSETNKISSTVENEVLDKERRIEYLESIKSSKENQIKKVDNALEILTEEDRKLIELRYFERVPNYKVAQRFNMTEEGCSARKRRIIENIKDILILD